MCLFQETVKSKLIYINKETLDIKIIYMNFLSLAERNLNDLCNKSFKDKLNQKDLIALSRNYLGLAIFDVKSINEYTRFLGGIRDILSHFDKYKHLEANANSSFIKTIIKENKLMYALLSFNDITFYGLTVLISMMLDSKHINEFITTLKYLKGAFNGNKKAITKQKEELYENIIKIAIPSNYICKDRVSEYSTKLRLSLIGIIMTFEMELNGRFSGKMLTQSPDMLDLLLENKILNRDRNNIDKIKFLRNMLYHGILIDEEVIFNHKKIKITLSFIIEILIYIKELVLENNLKDDHKLLLDRFNDFALHILNLKFHNLLEVSYKISSSNLIRTEKMKTRLRNATRLAKDIIEDASIRISNKDIENVAKLLNEPTFEIVVSNNHFEDFNTRIYRGDKIHLAHFVCERNIFINNVDCQSNNFYIIENYKKLKNIIDILKNNYIGETKQTREINSMIDVTEIQLKPVNATYDVVGSY